MAQTVLDATFASLKRIRARGTVVVASPEGARDRYEVMLFPGATAAQISSAQALLARAVPEDFLAFWRLTNGANLFVNESGLHGVGIASTELIIDLQQEEAEFYGADALRDYLVVARVNGAGDFLVLDCRTGRVLDGVHSEQPGEWREIAASFSEWLSDFVQTRGRYYWIEELYQSVELTEA